MSHSWIDESYMSKMWCSSFSQETSSLFIHTNPAFGTSCLQGKIHLDPFLEPPTTIQDLLTGSSLHSTSFLKNIHRYNVALAFTSLAVNLDHQVSNKCIRPSNFPDTWCSSS
jgi:hypothetical protein